jgi:hypothetical protein
MNGITSFMIALICTVAFGCGSTARENARNERLTDFRSRTIIAMSELDKIPKENYLEIASEEFNPKTDTILFDNNLISVSYLAIVNGCGRYRGDIVVKSDSIFLKLTGIGEYACNGERCDRLVFTIKNPGNKQYTIIKTR